jgi:hypothetical protein
LCRQKGSEVPKLYNSEPTCRNLAAERGLHRILRESLPPKLRRRLPRPAEPRDQRDGPHRLGLEPRKCLLDQRGRDSAASQVEANRLVPLPSLGERLGAGAGDAAVVEVADPFERLERLLALGVADPGPREPVVDLPP